VGDERDLKTMARRKAHAGRIAKKLRRTEGATRQKAFSIGLSLSIPEPDFSRGKIQTCSLGPDAACSGSATEERLHLATRWDRWRSEKATVCHRSYSQRWPSDPPATPTNR
jgi:hypothetical protein